MSPRTLRVVAWVFFALPFVGLFTGYYKEHPARGAFQAAVYFVIFVGLNLTAKLGERQAPK